MGERQVADFQGIWYSNNTVLQPTQGRLKVADQGLAFRDAATGTITSIESKQMRKLVFLRAAKDYELRIFSEDSSVHQFDGFKEDDLETLNSYAKVYGLPISRTELSLKGWNWGRHEFTGNNLSFIVGNKPAFYLPMTAVSNTTLAAKNEVSVEFVQPEKPKKNEDSLVEMRFYVPGKANVTVDGEDGKDNETSANAEEESEMTAASLFHDTIKDKADIGVIAGEELCKLENLLSLTPRGRFDLLLYATFLRLRGKSHDYKILYNSIKRVFSLPKPDDMHQFLVMALDPPIRQGQTRYPFLVFQMSREDEAEIEMNLTEEELKTKFDGKLSKSYDNTVPAILEELLPIVTGRPVILPAKAYTSAHSHAAVKCSYKAHEAYLYPLDKHFLFIPKPAIFFSTGDIAGAVVSRVGSAATTTRTFEIRFTLRGGSGEYTFGNINREEFAPLSSFLAQKGVKVKNEMAEEARGYVEGSSDSDSDTGGRAKVTIADADGWGEDSESEDEDFVVGRGGNSDSDSSDSDESSDEEPQEEQPKKKKAKRDSS